MAAKWEEAKTPTGELDYEIDWADWLGDDTIAGSSWEVPAGLIDLDRGGVSGSKCVVWLGGGTNDKEYPVKNTITTTAGRTCTRTVVVKVKER